MNFLLEALTSLRRSMNPSIASQTPSWLGNKGLRRLSCKKASYFLRLHLSPNVGTSLHKTGFSFEFSLSRLTSCSSGATYFLRDDYMTKDCTFCMRASSSCLQALLSYLWVLSILFFTIENFCTVHLLTFIRVFIFVRASESSLSTVETSLFRNWL